MHEIDVQSELQSFDKMQVRVINCGKCAQKWRESDTRPRLDYFRLFFVLSGEVTFTQKEQQHILTRNDLVLVPPHSTFELSIQDRNTTYYYVSFELTPTKSIKEFLVYFNNHYVFRKLSGNVAHTMESIFVETTGANYGYQIIVNALTKSLLVQMLRMRNAIPTLHQLHYSSFSSKEELVHQAKYYVQQNLHEAIKVTQIAKSLGITPNYLYKLFIETNQVSIQEYILQSKIEYATVLLRNPEFNIKEVAEQLSFSSQNHFSNTFKRYMNISPTHYRKSLLQSH